MDEHDTAMRPLLAGLVSTSGRLFTLIRARTWDAETDPGKAPEVVRDVMAWADAAHNLAVFGQALGAEGSDQARIDRDARGLVRALEAAASQAEVASPMVAKTLREAAGLVTAAADCARRDPTPPSEEGPGIDG
jgi:hypothetical protein